jgi:hypothetical protein
VDLSLFSDKDLVRRAGSAANRFLSFFLSFFLSWEGDLEEEGCGDEEDRGMPP